MSTISETTYFNKSAYVALSCLIAFVIVITICVIKQFIWDPLLSKHFKIIRPVLSESVRNSSSSFHRASSTRTSTLSMSKSLSDACVKINDPPTLSNKNLITVTQSLPSNGSEYNPVKKTSPRRSYGSSFQSYAYLNYGSDDLSDEQINTPTLHFSCEYEPSTCSIRLNVQNLRHMNIFRDAINSNASILIRFILSPTVLDRSYETSRQHYQDFIRFGETFIILNSVHPGDMLNYQINFFMILIVGENVYQIAEAVHSMKHDYLTYAMFVERTVPMHLKLIESAMK